jgi:GT2 family glycosyltransferase
LTKIAVIIVNWNGAQDTIKCIRSLQAINKGPNELCITVTDNGSTDGSYASLTNLLIEGGYIANASSLPISLVGRIKEAESFTPADANLSTVTLIAARENTGFAGGNNIAVEFCDSSKEFDFFWFVNNDTEFDKDALATLIKKMRSNPQIGICGSTLLYASDRNTVQAYGGALYSMFTGRAWAPGAGLPFDPAVQDEWAEARINYVSGAAMLVRAALLKEVGLMSEDYFLYNEEIDLALRASNRYRLGVATQSIVYHRVGASIGTEDLSVPASDLATFFQTRSKLLFAAKHTPVFYPLVWLTLLAKGLKLALGSARRAEAIIIFAVIAGKRKVNPRWFHTQSNQEGAIGLRNKLP